MTSPFSDELLSAYLDGELNAEERASVEAQLRERAELRRLCDELRALRATLQALPVARPPENFAERVLRQAERQMLADTGPSVDKPKQIGERRGEAVEPRKRRFIDNPRWRIGIGVVVGLAACVLVMAFLAPPAAFQTPRTVAVAPDAIVLPLEGTADLAVEPSDGSTLDLPSNGYRNSLVQGKSESKVFADGVSTEIMAADEAEKTDRYPGFEGHPAAPAMAGSARSYVVPPDAAVGRADDLDVSGGRGATALGELGMLGGGMPGGAMGEGGMGLGGMPGGAMSDVGMGGSRMAEGMDPGAASAEPHLFALPLEGDAWLGTPLTAETMGQCTTQLDQAHFLLVKVSAPENTKEESASTDSSNFSRGAPGPQDLFSRLRTSGQAIPELNQILQEPGSSNSEFMGEIQTPQQVLVVDASSERIQASIDQLVSQPDVSVELATIDSAAARQLVDRELVFESGRMLSEQLEIPKLRLEVANGPPVESIDTENSEPNRKAVEEAEAAPAVARSKAGLAKDQPNAAAKPSLGRTEQATVGQATAGQATVPDRAARRQDSKSAVDRVVFYILYRLVPETAPPAPVGDADGR